MNINYKTFDTDINYDGFLKVYQDQLSRYPHHEPEYIEQLPLRILYGQHGEPGDLIPCLQCNSREGLYVISGNPGVRKRIFFYRGYFPTIYAEVETGIQKDHYEGAVQLIEDLVIRLQPHRFS
jgi:hypothetical protein